MLDIDGWVAALDGRALGDLIEGPDGISYRVIADAAVGPERMMRLEPVRGPA